MGLFKSDKPPQLGEKEISMAPPDNPTQQGEKEISDTPDDHEYPSGLRLVLLITSIFIAMFLVALVRPKLHTPQCKPLTSLFAGQTYHLNCHTDDHQRIPRVERGRLVWYSLLAGLWENIYLLQR